MNKYAQCQYILHCGTCVKTGKICPHVDTEVSNNQPDTIYVPPQKQDTQLWGWVPEACRTCSSHPMNGGSGLCSCSLAYPEVGTITATLTGTSMSVKNDGSSSSSVTIDNSNTPHTYTTVTTSGNTSSTLEDK